MIPVPIARRNPARRPEPPLPHVLSGTTRRPPVEPRTTRIRLHLKPGQRATKQLLAQYGDPPRPRFANDQIVALRIAFPEVAVRERVKQAGRRWNPDRQAWEIRYDHAVALALEGRIVDEPASTSGCQG